MCELSAVNAMFSLI